MRSQMAKEHVNDEKQKLQEAKGTVKSLNPLFAKSFTHLWFRFRSAGTCFHGGVYSTSGT